MTIQRKKTISKVCPQGLHNVRTHLEHIHPSKKHPEGIVITRHRHCAKNPSRKSHREVLSFNDIRVTAKNFAKLIDHPMSLGRLGEFPKADKYYTLIGGWTSYWDKIFKPKDPLDPKLVKALMATESGFNEKAINTAYKLRKKYAHGLLQVTGGNR